MSTELRFDPDPSGQAGQAGLEGQTEYPLESAVAATDVATQAAPARYGRNAVTIQNANADAGDNVYVGNEDVTDTTGLRLQPGEGVTLEGGNAVYVITSSGETADVRVLEDG